MESHGGSSHELVNDFLEGGSGDSRDSSYSESVLADIAHLADKISVCPWKSQRNCTC